jgi:nickel-dependent lactate racemase
MSNNSDTMVELEIPYGRTFRHCRVPRRNLAEILSPRRVQASLEQEAARLAEALDNPVGTPRLEDTLRPHQRVAILVDDLSRPTPVARMLPAVLERVSRAGVPDDHVTVVIALGTHRPMTPAEIEAHIGAVAAGLAPGDVAAGLVPADVVAGLAPASAAVRRVRVENHNFQDTNQLAYIGKSSDGIPVWINRHVKEADFRIAVGSIVPHGVAGWTGGGKIIYPGVAGIETVDGFHGAFGTDLHNRLGADDTPIRADIERLVGYVGLEFIVNAILTGDGVIYRAVAGHFRQAHRQGVVYAREVYAVPCRVAADIALVSSYPADVDFWQAGKALYSGELLLREGGTLILLTPCPEGVVQNHDLLYYMRFRPAELLTQLQKHQAKDRAAAAAALRVGLVARRVHVVVVSDGLSEADAAGLGFAYARELQWAVDNALASYDGDCKLSVLTHGGELFPDRDAHPK